MHRLHGWKSLSRRLPLLISGLLLAALGAFGGWLGSLLTVFIAALHYTVLEANTSVPPHLPSPLLWSVLGGFVGAVLSWQALFYLRFRSASPT